MKQKICIYMEEEFISSLDDYLTNKYHGAISRSQFITLAAASAMNRQGGLITCD